MALDMAWLADHGERMFAASVRERHGFDEVQLDRLQDERATRLVAWKNCGNPHHRVDFTVPDNDILVSRHGAAELLERVRILAERIDCACTERIGAGRQGTTWAQADLWFPEASVYFDRDVAPEGWEARLSVEKLPAPIAVEWARGPRHYTSLPEDSHGPRRWILWADDMACVERTRMLGPGACRCVMWTGAQWERRVGWLKQQRTARSARLLARLYRDIEGGTLMLHDDAGTQRTWMETRMHWGQLDRGTDR